jgi:hypothetical protein
MPLLSFNSAQTCDSTESHVPIYIHMLLMQELGLLLRLRLRLRGRTILDTRTRTPDDFPEQQHEQ